MARRSRVHGGYLIHFAVAGDSTGHVHTPSSPRTGANIRLASLETTAGNGIKNKVENYILQNKSLEIGCRLQ